MGPLPSCVQPFFAWLVRTTLVAGILTCLILAIQRLLGRRLGPRWSHALWLVLLLRMVLPWAPPSPVSLFSLMPAAIHPAWPPPDRMVALRMDNPQPVGTLDSPTADSASEPSAKEPTRGRATQGLGRPGEARFSSGSAWQTICHSLPILWLAGAIVLGGYLFAGNFALWRIIKREHPLISQPILESFEECRSQMGVQTIVALVPSEQVHTAALFGFIRPRLLLPRGLVEDASREEMRYIFLHELAHLKRRDIYLGWLTSVLQVLHWFNPLVWLAFYRMRMDRELACDALVLARTGSQESQEYGQAIVALLRRFSRSRPLPAMAGVLENKAQLKRRIAMITQFKHNSYRFSPLAAVLIVILACISLPEAMHTRASETAIPQPAKQLKFTKVRIPNRIMWDAQLSPDGKNIAFVNEKTIWIMPRTSRLGPGYPGVPKQLDTAGVKADWCGLTWSRDGKWIAFNGEKIKEGYQRIYVVSADGGKPKQVHENNRDVRVVNYRMSLSPNGKTLAFSSVDANELYIYTIDVDGGEPRRLVDTPAREPVFSPDGRMIAFVEARNLSIGGGGGLWTVPATGGVPTLVAETRNASSPVWSPDGKMLAFIDNEEDKQIHIVPLTQQGGPAGEKISIDRPEEVNGVRRLTGWTPGNMIGAIFGTPTEFALYIQPLQGGKATFVTHGGYPLQPRWSPDGKRIYHTNKTNAASGDWTRAAVAWIPAEGGDVTTIPLTAEHKIRLWGYGTGNRISPDGKTIVFAGQKPKEGSQRMHIWTLPIHGGTPKLLTDVPLPFRDWYPCWSPDGKNIAFVRMEIPGNWAVSGKADIHIVSADAGEPKKITSESDMVFDAGPVIWSPNGKLLAYFSRDKDDAADGTIKVISPDGREPRIVAKVEEIFANKEMAWSADSKRIAYNAPDNKIKIVTLDDGSIEEIEPDLKDVNIYHLDWSPDGKTLVFGGYTGGGPEFWTMESFLPETTVAEPEPMTTVRRIGGDWGTFASLSPDGRYMCNVDQDTETLAVLELATGKVRHVTSKSPDDTCYPLDSAISSDSREVAYLWWDPNTKASSLHMVGLDGSGDRLLYEGRYPMPRAWSADGKKILAVVSEDDVQQMVWVSASDGSMERIASFPGESLGYPGKFDISPDGRFIAYDRPQAEDAPKRDIVVFDLSKNGEASLVAHPADDRLLGWTPDGRHVLFASDRAGSWDAWLQQVAAGKPQGFPKLAKDGIGDVRPIGFTPYGSYYYAQERILEDVFTARLDLDTGEVISEPVPVRQTGTTSCHDWSPDGRYLAYCERRSDESQVIHIRTLTTGGERTLADNLPYIRWLRWSLDGRSILIDGAKSGDSQGVIHKIDVRTGERTDLVRSETEVLLRPEMSPDGKTLYYARNDPKSRTTRLMARDLESGREEELIRIDPPARLTGSALSPDGRRLVLSMVPSRTGSDGPVLKTISTAGGQPRELLQFAESEKLRTVGVTWVPDSRNVLFWKWFEGFRDLELGRISTDGGIPRRLWSRKALGHMRIHPDGERVAFYDRSTTRGVWVMENFLPQDAGK